METEEKWVELGLFFKRKGSAIVVVTPEEGDRVLDCFDRFLRSGIPAAVRFQCRREDSEDLATIVLSLAEVTYIGASALIEDKQ